MIFPFFELQVNARYHTRSVLWILVLSALASTLSSWAQESTPPAVTGQLHGLILDRTTQQPLVGANVLVVGHQLGAIAGVDGRFAIGAVPAGVHRLQVSMIGYSTLMWTDVVVRGRRMTDVELELVPRLVEVGETIVQADYFAEMTEEPVSAVNFHYEEIRRSPGAAGDISRLVQALPSVGMNNDQRNDLIVRGGSPTENLILIDNIEIPNINHFPTQGASGGPIGLLNTDLIEDIDFYTGGFSASYGDKLSSVMVIDMRDGNRREFDGEVNLGMAGAGLIFEGPLAAGRGAWILSGRLSYLDLIVDAIGTGAVPKYSDVQGKLSWDVGDNHRFSILGIGGFDFIDIVPGDTDGDDDFVAQEVDQAIVGGNWKWLWSQRGYANTSLAVTRAVQSIDVQEGISRDRLYLNESVEREVVLRSDATWSPSTTTQLSWGITARRLLSEYEIFAAADTNRLNQVVPALGIDQEVTTTKLGLYGSLQRRWDRLTATAGLRFDYFAYNEEIDLAPRLSLSYEVRPLTTISAAWGIYYQNLPPSLLVQHPANADLENPRADHYVLGLRHRLTPSTLLTLEGYYKDYSQMPFDTDDPTVSIVDAYADFGAPFPGELIGGGEAVSWGGEAMVQKKLAEKLYGTLSYAFGRSQYTDLAGRERDRNFDNRHLFSVIVGYRPSDTWEFSTRWRYAGGRPYSPFDQTLSTQLGTGIIDPVQINEERLPAYHRLDLRIDHRKQYDHFNVVSFFTLLNAYNRANLFTYYWDKSDNGQGRIDQWSFLPVGGFELEF